MSSFLSRAVLAAALCSPTLVVAQDAPVTGGESAAPAETDAKTRAFLEEAAAEMYQPARHGLESLSFDLGVPGPTGATIATLHCSWSKDGGIEVSKELDLSSIPEAQRPLVEQQTAALDQQGHEYMTLQLNNVLANNLKDKVATLRGVEGGLIAVQWEPKPGSQLPPIEETYFFDDDYRWVRTEGSISMQGQSLETTETLTWSPIAGTDEVAQTKMSNEMEFPFGTLTQTLDLERADMHGFHLVESLKITMSMPPGQPPQTMTFDNIVVNGKPYPGDGEG